MRHRKFQESRLQRKWIAREDLVGRNRSSERRKVKGWLRILGYSLLPIAEYWNVQYQNNRCKDTKSYLRKRRARTNLPLRYDNPGRRFCNELIVYPCCIPVRQGNPNGFQWRQRGNGQQTWYINKRSKTSRRLSNSGTRNYLHTVMKEVNNVQLRG